MKEVKSMYKNELIQFTQDLIRVESYSGDEAKVAKIIKKKMIELEYDDVFIDSLGNVVGRIGDGEKIIMFDSHMDTVEVHNHEDWIVPPFEGEILNGKLYGRGSVDMKSAIAATVYAGAIAKRNELHKNVTIYVSCTVHEEYCDGENLKHLFAETDIRPDYVVICEPSNNNITLGHNGKAQVVIRTEGISAHSAAPDEGENAIYEMTEIIQRIEQLHEDLSHEENRKGTVTISDISSTSASLNAVPSQCKIYLDRRITLGITKEDIYREMDSLVEGKKATWELGTLIKESWTEKQIKYTPFHLAWKIAEEHELTQFCSKAYKKVFQNASPKYDFWNFGTNAVTPVSMGIPTIGFGPGDYRQAHMTNEHCEVSQIKESHDFYVHLIEEINQASLSHK